MYGGTKSRDSVPSFLFAALRAKRSRFAGRLRYNRRVLLFLLLYPLLMIPDQSGAWWSEQSSGVDSSLRGVSVTRVLGGPGPPHFVVWASGSNGVVLRSLDEGKTWKKLHVPGGEELDFRDVEAFDGEVAYVMSSGDGEKSRIYKTSDGGRSWQLQYSDKRAGFFLDSLACSSRTHCVALSDPVEGKFVVLRTDDGQHWSELPREKMPAALPQEGAFAASGTAIALCGGGIYFGTGGPKARIFRSMDSGRSWTVRDTPIASGNASSGVFSLACAGPKSLVAVGGDYQQPAKSDRVAMYSNDGGETWQLAAEQPGGYRSGVGVFGSGDFVAVGTNGTDVSHDQGVHWEHTDQLNLNAVGFDAGGGWAVGPKGTIARFQPR